MDLPVSQYPSLKAQEVLRRLAQFGYGAERTRGSHRKLTADGRPDIWFSYHHGDTVPPRALRKILVKDAQFSENEISRFIS
ncbi:MAG: type II toxin-antitoxin system HicA family toxin [Acidimicrobiia bacterium]|nr:type II toxin-antitoxin system HicA family toxin [Acidimicrobiia bacterium]